MNAHIDLAQSEALRLRWISVQCYEMVLPNGKVIVTDPFYWDGNNYDALPSLNRQQEAERKVYAQTGFSVESFTGADYILISHAHGDHTNLTGKLWNRFYGRVLVPAGAAEEIARVYNIPYGAVMPLYPGNTYYLDDFTLTVYPGAHDNRAFREGRFLRPDRSENQDMGSDAFGIPSPNRLAGLGYMFCFNFLIETQQNYRIDFSAGRDFPDHVRHVADKSPNLMLRHRIRTYTPEEYARQMEAMGAQLMMPLHHNNARASDEDLDEYFQRVNQVLQADRYPGVAFNPRPYQWYRIYTGISGI